MSTTGRPRILIQLDTDPHPSVFDGVVAVDAGVDHLFQFGSVSPENVRELVHGAMFTRGPKDLHNTAIFVGGSNVTRGEEVLKAVSRCFFGPMRVSVLLDANGANTTAAAAVLAAARHLNLSESTAVVLAGTGPVGQRAVRLLSRQGSAVRVASRSLDRAEHVCEQLSKDLPEARLAPLQTATADETTAALRDADVAIAAGAAGVSLISASQLQQAGLKVAIDLNAVPPLGIEGVEVAAKAVSIHQTVCYGAIGVGGTKMKIHSRAIAELFTSKDRVLDADEIYELGAELE